ncbi:MAG: thioredoxin family protein [Synergistaceae bacterium]|jgi:small redox-active disulfide protein 2|nr:thioredoxin family protein [Synergistaceae bacterium]
MKVQILGTGCPKCKKLAELTDQAAKELGFEFEIEKVTEVAKIMDFGVMSTPALAIDGKVVLAGHLPAYEKIKEMLVKAGSVQEPEVEETGGCSL